MMLFQSGSIFERRWYMMRVSQLCRAEGDSDAPSSIAKSVVAFWSMILSMYW